MSEVKVSVGLVSSEVSLFGLEISSFLYVFTWPSLCLYLCPDILFLYEFQSVRLGPTCLTSF